MKVDITKPVKTCSGEDVTIISDKGRGDYPLVGYIGDGSHVYYWSVEGKLLIRAPQGPDDIVQEPEKKTLWVNVYREGSCLARGLVAHRTKENADSMAVSDRIACVKVTYHDGQFDEE